ncbi:MAG TPA: MBL fold metallo-hydrolase [Desulfatiglandales bacterium]|jgi:glyoxylase-like metal-dependent hydrolase (beta-lactamase superfamily II)|nr:MBL fold metallo-hydrolase [Desulfatiglandales bacterium]
MPEITKGVYFIPGQDEMIPDAHVYVIGLPSSEDLSIVDAGLTGKGAYKIQAIQKLGIKLSDIKRIIMTHTHFDHIGCLEEIRAQIPHAELWIHEDEADPIEKGDERGVYGVEMFRTMCMSQYGLKPGYFKFKVDRKLKEGEKLDMGGLSWDVLHIPGHSAGSIGLYDRSQKVLIPGDVVYADYAIGRFDLHGADGSVLARSLLRLAELEVEILLPGHNRVVKGVKPGYIRDTAKQWAPYLR